MIKTIAIIIVMVAVNTLMVISIRRSAARVDYSLRRHFGLKLTNDGLLKEETDIQKVEEFIQEKSEDSPHIETKAREPYFTENIQSEPYKYQRLNEDYKLIKTLSKYTPEYALECTKKITGDQPLNKFDYKGLLDLLSFDTICDLNTLDPQTQEKLLQSYMPEDSRPILDEYLKENDCDFNSIDFYGYLREMADIYNSGYIVINGNPNEDASALPEGSKLIYDHAICEGSKVVYGNREYDFSIKG